MVLASKIKSGICAWLCVMVVMLGLGENRAWGFFAQPQPAPGVYESTTQEPIRDFYDASQYDASDYAVAAKTPLLRQTTVLGENMRDRVIPFADATNARTLPWGTTPERWAQMTPQQRWKLNDGALRARINEGDSFRYIGIDPGRPVAERLRFDLTRSELLRLNDRGIPYQTVTPREVISTIGRP